MQHDFYSFPGVETVHRLSRLQPRSQRAIREIERLKSWDGNLDARTIAGTVYHAFTVAFAGKVVRAAVADERLIERYLNKSGAELFGVVSSPWRFQARMLELWEEGDAAWFASTEHPEGRGWNDVALESLEAALDDLEERFGPDPGAWRWGRVHGVEFSHPFGAANPVFRRIFNRFVETGGASETVTQNGYLLTDPFRGVWGPVYRMLADLGDRRRSRWQLTTGQSGHPGSRHYDDLLDGWRDGRTNPCYVDEHELRAAGGVRQLRLDPDY
jgi:penicillin G amidase